MKIAITGSSGLIGTKLIESLTTTGAEVHGTTGDADGFVSYKVH